MSQFSNMGPIKIRRFTISLLVQRFRRRKFKFCILCRTARGLFIYRSILFAISFVRRGRISRTRIKWGILAMFQWIRTGIDRASFFIYRNIRTRIYRSIPVLLFSNNVTIPNLNGSIKEIEAIIASLNWRLLPFRGHRRAIRMINFGTFRILGEGRHFRSTKTRVLVMGTIIWSQRISFFFYRFLRRLSTFTIPWPSFGVSSNVSGDRNLPCFTFKDVSNVRLQVTQVGWR